MFHTALNQAISGQRVVKLSGNTYIRVRHYSSGNLRLGHDPVHLNQNLSGVLGGIPISQADCIQAGGSVGMVWSGDLYAVCDGVASINWILEFDPSMLTA